MNASKFQHLSVSDWKRTGDFHHTSSFMCGLNRYSNVLSCNLVWLRGQSIRLANCKLVPSLLAVAALVISATHTGTHTHSHKHQRKYFTPLNVFFYSLSLLRVVSSIHTSYCPVLSFLARTSILYYHGGREPRSTSTRDSRGAITA